MSCMRASEAAEHVSRHDRARRSSASHYAARYIEGVKIGPSPLWMQNRLMAAGIRPINNIVDITNYRHAGIRPAAACVRRRPSWRRPHRRAAGAAQAKRCVTLDDQERKLEPHMLVITDGEKPVALAGVMGGANSEVTRGHDEHLAGIGAVSTAARCARRRASSACARNRASASRRKSTRRASFRR